MTATQEYDWKADVEPEQQDAEAVQASNPQTESEPEIEEKQGHYQITAPKKLSDRPILLIGVVFGGMTGLIFLAVIGYGIFSTLGSAIHAEKNKNSDPATESFSVKTPFNKDRSVTEKQRLQEQLTSKETDASITRFNASTQPEPKPEPKPASKPPTPNRVVAPRVVYRDRVVTKPTPAPKPKVVYRERPAPKAAPRPVAPPPPIRRQSDQAPQDPYEQWGQLASLGMVGGGEVASNPSSPYAPQDALYIDSSQDVVPVFNPSAFPESFSEPEPEIPQPTVNLPLGMVVKGKLMHDVSFVDGSTSTDKAVVQLSEPLGEIPEGAMISTQIQSVDDSGALSMSILGYEYDNLYQEVSLPEIQVTSARASSGSRGNFGRIFKDVVGIGLDVLGNETGQEIQFDNGRVASISTDTNSGLLDRSVDAISSRLLERNRSSASRSRRSPKVKEGSTVKFTVMEPFN